MAPSCLRFFLIVSVLAVFCVAAEEITNPKESPLDMRTASMSKATEERIGLLPIGIGSGITFGCLALGLYLFNAIPYVGYVLGAPFILASLIAAITIFLWG